MSSIFTAFSRFIQRLNDPEADTSSVLVKILPFLGWLPLVNRASLRADMIAGLTGAVIVLPQGVAFATIAGLPPVYGLYTAMITPVIAGLFGSSRHLVSGPTTAISIVVFTAINQHAQPGSPEFISLALTLTFLAGVYQFAFGLARLGVLVNFVSHTVVIGFTAGAAILIATSQMKHVLGVDIERGHTFLHTWNDLFSQLVHSNVYVIAIGAVTLGTALLCKRLIPKMPNLLIGLVVGSLFAVLINGASHGVAFIGSIPAHLPPLSSPEFSFHTIRALAPQAFAIALLGLIEAVSISRSVATRSHQRIDGNQEFIGQGLSNIVGSFFSSYAGSGSFTRTGINYDAGAQTPMSAIFAALSLMLIVLLIAPLTAYLPVAAMGGVILLVAYNLVDFHHIGAILRTNRQESAILLVTFFSTLFLELEFAIYIGVLLSIVLFLANTSKPRVIVLAPDPQDGRRRLTNIETKPVAECPQLKVIRINRPIYFGSINYLQTQLQRLTRRHKVNHVLLIANNVDYIDMAGAEMLVQEAKRLQQLGGGLFVVGLKGELWQFLGEGKFLKTIGPKYFFDNKTNAIGAIFFKLNRDRCAQCTTRIFKECTAIPLPDNVQ